MASTKRGERRYLALETLPNPLPEEAAARDPISLPPTKVRKMVDTTSCAQINQKRKGLEARWLQALDLLVGAK